MSRDEIKAKKQNLIEQFKQLERQDNKLFYQSIAVIQKSKQQKVQQLSQKLKNCEQQILIITEKNNLLQAENNQLLQKIKRLETENQLHHIQIDQKKLAIQFKVKQLEVKHQDQIWDIQNDLRNMTVKMISIQDEKLKLQQQIQELINFFRSKNQLNKKLNKRLKKIEGSSDNQAPYENKSKEKIQISCNIEHIKTLLLQMKEAIKDLKNSITDYYRKGQITKGQMNIMEIKERQIEIKSSKLQQTIKKEYSQNIKTKLQMKISKHQYAQRIRYLEEFAEKRINKRRNQIKQSKRVSLEKEVGIQ